VIPKRPLGLLLAAALAVPLAHADTLMVVKEGSRIATAGEEMPDGLENAFGGEERTVRYWSQPGRLARIDDNGKMISLVNERLTYMLNDRRKTCSAISHDRRESIDSSQAETNVRKTGETRQIGTWQAEGYELTAVSGNERYDVNLWVSDQVDPESGGQRRNVETMATPATTWMLKTFELGGYPVRLEFRTGAVFSWAELVSMEERAAPPDTYEIPDDYSGCE
jgi:hypothetical protein